MIEVFCAFLTLGTHNINHPGRIGGLTDPDFGVCYQSQAECDAAVPSGAYYEPNTHTGLSQADLEYRRREKWCFPFHVNG